MGIDPGVKFILIMKIDDDQFTVANYKDYLEYIPKDFMKNIENGDWK